MCGISGIIYNKTPKQTEKFKACANLQAHRGPDYTGYFGDNQSDFVHHRLSILDLDQRAHQPFLNLQKDRLLVYNGEIYNYKSLQEKYQLVTQTTSDTEILFQLLDNKSFNINELNGIFTFAEYHQQKQILKLTRDRLGVKPLYYYQDQEKFIFASEAKVIYAYLDELSLHPQALAEFLTFGHSNSEHTIISGVKKLQPGHQLVLDIKNFEIVDSEYWSASTLVNQQIKPTYQEAKVTTLNLLEKAVERQCISDVPVGAYLSGGIDSSAVVAMASKYTSNNLQTYSVNFEQSDKSELDAAKKVAQTFGTEHHEFQVSAQNFEDTLSKLIYQYDEPFADAAMIPLHFLAEKAALSSSVVLQGDGGDEVFGGYGRYLDLQQYQLRKWSFWGLKYFHPKASSRQSGAQRYQRLNHKSTAKLMASLVERDAQIDLNAYYINQSQFKNISALSGYIKSDQNFKTLPLMQRMLYTDMQNILPYKYLEKVDKVNMFHSIEARVPLLDNDLVDYVMRLPQSYKIKHGRTKYFLRDILKGIVPDEILNAKKQSFGTPVLTWLTTNLFNFTLDQFEQGKSLDLPFDYDRLILELKNMKQGHYTNQSNRVWKFLVLTVWLSFYSDKIKGIEQMS